jgi:hypothetical protein
VRPGPYLRTVVDLGDIWQALANLANRDANFLDMLGRTREERVEKISAMLRNSDDADIAEMGIVFGLAMAKVGEPAGPAPNPPRRDPLALWIDGVRRMVRFDPRDVLQGLEYLVRPSAAGMLEALGRTRRERAEKLAGMLRTVSPPEMEEMATTYALAMAQAGESRHRRRPTAAERRRERMARSRF